MLYAMVHTTEDLIMKITPELRHVRKQILLNLDVNGNAIDLELHVQLACYGLSYQLYS